MQPRAAWLEGACTVAVALVMGASPAFADHDPGAPALDWQSCGDAAGVQCATASVPRDYAQPDGAHIRLFVARSPATDPAHRIGSLFLNFGGPGGTMADIVEAVGTDLFPVLNERFDIVGMDPRGVGQSEPSIDCHANQETQGIYSRPFTTPDNLVLSALLSKDRGYVNSCVSQNRAILPYVTTGNVARDLDVLRAAVGDNKLNYLGFSYGTLVGATYAALFPSRYRVMVLDGPVDADSYLNHPLNDLASQTSGFERAFGRFMTACAAHQDTCRGFGGDDPLDAFDQLAARMDQTPLPADGFVADPRPVGGDDLRIAAVTDLYAKQFWPELAGFLADAQNGDGSGIRFLVDLFDGRNDDGTFDPFTDRYFTIGAVEQRYPPDVGLYLDAGAHSWAQHEHFWWNNGYVELNYGIYPVVGRGAFYGPFTLPDSAATALVVATTYDPATPYRGATRLVRELGNARLLTMRGDGHTAYGEGSPDCIDPAIEDYLIHATLPAAGTSCRQDLPFVQPAPLQAKSLSAANVRRPFQRPHTRPIVR